MYIFGPTSVAKEMGVMTGSSVGNVLVPVLGSVIGSLSGIR